MSITREVKRLLGLETRRKRRSKSKAKAKRRRTPPRKKNGEFRRRG